MKRPTCLITGMNKSQCVRKHFLRMNLKVVPSHYSLFNCLVDMGYEVEQRPVELGEDLSEYDEVIVYIAGPRQLVATNVYEGLWAISQRPDCILALDDWQVPDLFKGVIKAGQGDELFAQFILDVNKKTLGDVKPFEKQLRAAIETIAARKNRMLISAFDTSHLNDPANFGAHLLFDKVGYSADRVFTFNPNPYHRNRRWGDLHHEGAEDPTWTPPLLSYTVGPKPKKECRFNFASLVQSKTQKWLKKQGYTGNPKDDEQGMIGTWPVDLYGSKAESQKRLTEDQMVQVITLDWGCLMPAYDHSGSGWWRARPLQCADAGSILVGDEKELRVYYGNDYPFYGLKAIDLVDCHDGELEEIATTQAQSLYKLHPLDKAVQVAELQAVLSADK